LKGKKALLRLNNSSIEELTIALSNHLGIIKVGMPYYLSDRKNRYSAWLDNMNYDSTQNAIKILIIATLTSKEQTWLKFEKKFKNLCFQIKLFFYGAWFSADLAFKFANHLLSLLLSASNIHAEDTQTIQRLDALSGHFANTISYPWVKIAERDPLVWDAANWESSDSISELEFIISQLKLVGPVQRAALSPIYKAISEYQTAPWPVAH
jgi:hypothetical protein